MGVGPERLAIVPVGADHELFRPLPGVRRVARADHDHSQRRCPDEGLAYLLEALAKLRTRYQRPICWSSANPGG